MLCGSQAAAADLPALMCLAVCLMVRYCAITTYLNLLKLLPLLLLQVAFDLIEDMRASGLKPSTPTCSALMYACLQNNNFAAARKVNSQELEIPVACVCM
jgi:hypothetical protein